MAEAGPTTPEMTAKQRKFLIYLVMRQQEQMRFGEMIDSRTPIEDLLKTLYCSLCGKWVRGSARMCTGGHYTCGPHSAIIPRCPLETKGNIERGPVTDHGEACGKRFCKGHPVFIRIFYGVARLLQKTNGVLDEPTEEEEDDMRRRFLGVEDEYLEKLIEWAKTKEVDILADKQKKKEEAIAAKEAAKEAAKAQRRKNGHV